MNRSGAKRAATTAGGFNVWIVELKARTFHGLDIIDLGSVQVKEAGLIDEDFQSFEVVGLVEHSGVLFERHRIAEAGATTTDNGNPQTGRLGFLGVEDLLNFVDGGRG